MLTACGLRHEICDYGTIVEATTAITIEANPTLSEEDRLEELRQMRVVILERLKCEIISILEAGGYFISEEEGGYTQILFQHSRIVCLSADSFIEAIHLLLQDYGEALPFDVYTNVSNYETRDCYLSHSEYDCPKVPVPRVPYRKLTLDHMIVSA